VKITTVTPLFNEAARDEQILSEAKKSGLWESTLDVRAAVKDADFVIPKQDLYGILYRSKFSLRKRNASSS
jgi:alpha-galactosidase/6-phospho-beta-glucosidase family protein